MQTACFLWPSSSPNAGVLALVIRARDATESSRNCVSARWLFSRAGLLINGAFFSGKSHGPMFIGLVFNVCLYVRFPLAFRVCSNAKRAQGVTITQVCIRFEAKPTDN
jgi:hypothetical protein